MSIETFKEYVLSNIEYDNIIYVVNEALKRVAVGKHINALDSPLYKERNSSEIVKHSPEEMKSALNNDKQSVRVMNKGIVHKEGDYVGARLNLNVFKNTGIPILTLHHGDGGKHTRGTGFFGGEAEAYKHTVTLKNAKFSVNQQARENIASGKTPKTVMASVDGQYHNTNSHSFHGVEAKFNPKREHVFVDEHGRAIKSAEEVTMHGHKVYMRGKIEYHTADTMPKKVGDSPSSATLHESDANNLTLLPDIDMYECYFGTSFEKLHEEIANVTGTPTTDTNGVSVPPTAKPDKKDKVMLLKKVINRKKDNPNG